MRLIISGNRDWSEPRSHFVVDPAPQSGPINHSVFVAVNVVAWRS